jgi:prepilin-type N-terminal cleavage/methylation domain-containing protein
MRTTERHVRSPQTTSRKQRGITLIELLIVATVLGILVGLVLVRYEPGIPDQLQSAGQVVASDVAYCRSLAIANNSKYRLVFDVAANRYYLEHSGTNTLLNNLPESPFRVIGEVATKQTTNLGKLPLLNSPISLVAVRRVGATTEQNSTTLEFDSLGALTAPETVKIWLSAGVSSSRRYVFVQINPVTGIAELGDLQVAAPPLIPGG